MFSKDRTAPFSSSARLHRSICSGPARARPCLGLSHQNSPPLSSFVVDVGFGVSCRVVHVTLSTPPQVGRDRGSCIWVGRMGGGPWRREGSNVVACPNRTILSWTEEAPDRTVTLLHGSRSSLSSSLFRTRRGRSLRQGSFLCARCPAAPRGPRRPFPCLDPLHLSTLYPSHAEHGEWHCLCWKTAELRACVAQQLVLEARKGGRSRQSEPRHGRGCRSLQAGTGRSSRYVERRGSARSTRRTEGRTCRGTKRADRVCHDR